MLDGGLPAWQRAGGELETSSPKEYSPATYPVPQKDESLVRSFEQITDLVKSNDSSIQILDARSSGRCVPLHSALTLDFMVTIQSHAKVGHWTLNSLLSGLSSGHIPGSISMPFQKLIDPKTGQFHDMEHIRDFFKSQLDYSKDTITSCGTGRPHVLKLIGGVTASILFLALEASEFPSKKSVYDGSWTEYASRHANDPDMIIKSR